MALSPADFAAYSRATGTPYPEDPEEKAQLAPQVAEFRRNQMRSTQQEPNIPNILGAAALGLGAIAGGLYAAKRLGAARAQVPPSKIPMQGIEAVQNIGSIGRQQKAEQVTRQARAERMPGVMQVDLSTVDRLLQDPELTSLVQSQAQEEAAELRSEMARQQAQVQKAKRQDLWNLVDEIRSENITAEQAINALNSGEDQMTGRIMRGVQRNEDLDASQVNSVLDQTNNVALAASLTPDGIPQDQTIISYSAAEKQFVLPGQRLQEQARRVAKYQTPTPVSLIAKYPASSEDPTNIGRFPGTLGKVTEDVVTYSPAYGGTSNVVRRGGLEITPVEGRISGQPARYTALPMGRKTEGLVFTPASPVLPMDAEQALQKLGEFQLSQEAQIASAMNRGLSEARAKRNVQITPSQQEAIETLLPGYSTEDVMSQPGLTAYGDIAEAERYAEELSSKAGRLQSLEQGGFLEREIDPGELRGEPRQVRKGVMVSPASKTSYRGVIGRPGYGIYGEQAGGRVGTPVFGAGAVEAAKEIKTEGESRGVTTPRKFLVGIDDPRAETPEGFVYTEEAMMRPSQAAGGYKKYGTQPPTPRESAKESLDVSSEILRLQREQGQQAAQDFLDKMMEERQISALGVSQPLRQRINRQGRFTV